MRRLSVLASAMVVAWSWMSGASAWAADPVAYLEGLKGKPVPYLAPSEIDARFTSVLYVNVAAKGETKQRMWVLHRDGGDMPWRLGMWDKDYWKKQKLHEGETPPFSWLISSGRYYKGDRKAGPTAPGIYALDERKWRYGRGWLQDGMVHVMHIDYHYAGGRVSGIAFHGTPSGKYRRLGSNDSHGCIRMHQKNALGLIDRMTGKDGVLSETVRWGEVPRYWRTEKGRTRLGYARDGKALEATLAENIPALSASPSTEPAPATDASPAAPASGELTKVGFRTLVVLFED